MDNPTVGNGLILAAGVLTALVSLHLCSPSLFVLTWKSRKIQPWRYVTTFLYFGRITTERLFGTMLNLITFSGFVKISEERVFHNDPYRFIFCLVSVCVLNVCGSRLAEMNWGVVIPLLSHSLSSSLVFVGCWRCPTLQLNLYGFPLTAKTGPWVSMLASFILSGEMGLYADLLGVGSALIYLLAMDYLPAPLLQLLPWDIGSGNDGEDTVIAELMLELAREERRLEREAERQFRLLGSDNEESDDDHGYEEAQSESEGDQEEIGGVRVRWINAMEDSEGEGVDIDPDEEEQECADANETSSEGEITDHSSEDKCESH